MWAGGYFTRIWLDLIYKLLLDYIFLKALYSFFSPLLQIFLLLFFAPKWSLGRSNFERRRGSGTAEGRTSLLSRWPCTGFSLKMNEFILSFFFLHFVRCSNMLLMRLSSDSLKPFCFTLFFFNQDNIRLIF